MRRTAARGGDWIGRCRKRDGHRTVIAGFGWMGVELEPVDVRSLAFGAWSRAASAGPALHAWRCEVDRYVIAEVRVRGE